MGDVILSKELYDLDSIQESITDFSEISNISLVDLEESYDLSIEVLNNSKDLHTKEEVTNEFCNYVLGIMHMKNKSDKNE